MTIHNASGYVQDAATRASLLSIRDHQRQQYEKWEKLADHAAEHGNEAVEAEARREMERYRIALLGMGFMPYSVEDADRQARKAEDHDTKPWVPGR